MKPFNDDIKKLALENNFFRKVIYTAPHCQLVVMSLKESEDIGKEVHTVDQVLFFKKGSGKAVLNNVEYPILPGSVFVVPAGTEHNFINSDEESMKLYTIYAPAQHKDGTIHETKADAEKDENDHA